MPRVERDTVKKRIGFLDVRQKYHTTRNESVWVGTSVGLVFQGVVRIEFRLKVYKDWRFGCNLRFWPFPAQITVFFAPWIVEVVAGGMSGEASRR